MSDNLDPSAPNASVHTPQASPPAKRGLAGFLFKSIPGCLLTGFVLLVALVAVLPTLAGGLVAGFVEKAVGDRVSGKLELGDVSLAWLSEQHVHDAVLLDPAGQRIARTSATLPSLWALAFSGGTKLGRVRVELDADLVADDAGVTNLERALAPREKKPNVTVSVEPPSESPLGRLDVLELDLELVSKRITWSDADTRALGKPFELRDLALKVAARPGAPLTCTLNAAVAGDSAGTLAIDARLEGLRGSAKSGGKSAGASEWPFGALAAKGHIENFSSALVDGLAGQRGKLKELLGATFSLRFDARDVTPERGEITAHFSSQTATRFDFAGRFENGVLRAQAGPLLDAELALPRAYLAEILVPNLPPGSKLDFGTDSVPWSVKIDAFECALPRGAIDARKLAPVFAAAKLDAQIALASPIGFENEATQRAFGRAVALTGTQITLALAPEAAPHVRVRSTLVAKSASPITLDVSAQDLWSALDAGTAPHVDAQLALKDVPVSALDAALALEPALEPLLGERLDVQLDARDAGRDRGRVTITARSSLAEFGAELELADGVVRTAAGKPVLARVPVPEAWLAQVLAPHLPADMSLTSRAGNFDLRIDELLFPLPPAAPSNAAPTDALAFLRGKTSARVHLVAPGASWTRAGAPGAPAGASDTLALESLSLDVVLAAQGSVDVSAELAFGLDAHAPTRATLRAHAADAWALASRAPNVPFPALDVALDAPALPARQLDVFAGPGERISGAFGPELALHLEAREFDLARGTVALKLAGARAQCEFAGTLADHVLRASGEQTFVFTAQPDANWLARELAAFLPAETTAGLGAVRCEVRELALTLPDPASTQPFSALALVESARAQVKLTVARVDFADPHTRTAGVDVACQNLVLATALEPGKPLEVSLGCAIVALERGSAAPNAGPGAARRAVAAGETSRGMFALEARLADPWFALRTPAAPLPPVDAHVTLTGLSTRTLDAFAGSDGFVSKLLGPSLDLDVRAERASLAGGDVKLAVNSQNAKLAFDGTLQDSTLVSSADGGLDLTLTLPPGWLEEQLTPKLPAGSRLALPADTQPLTLAVHGLRVPLASGPAPAEQPASANTTETAPGVLERLAGFALNADLRVPELLYSDASTAASGGAQVAIRGLHVTSVFARDQLPFARVDAELASAPPGVIQADVRALDPLKLLAEPDGVAKFRVACDVQARGIPTALVDALAGQEGLLVEALGPRLELTLKSASLSQTEGAIVADLVSDLHRVHCEGVMEQGHFRIVKQDGLVAHVGLGPIVNQKVVGKLVPMLVNLKKPDGSAPALIALSAFDFPLDGNLRGLDADVRIDLGEVTYALLPGLETYFGNAVDLKPTKLRALDVPIRKGVASYKDLSIPISGHNVSFSGSFDLVDLTMKFDTSLPLKLLGKKANAELERVREYVDPELAVPIEIRGTYRSPRVGFGDGFLKKVLEDAAKGGLGDLLDGLLKKKKKKD